MRGRPPKWRATSAARKFGRRWGTGLEASQIAIDEVWSALRFRPIEDVKSRKAIPSTCAFAHSAYQSEYGNHRYKKGIGSPSIAEGRLGRRLPYRMCSLRIRTRRTICLPCRVTNRTEGSGYADQRDRASFLRSSHDQTRPEDLPDRVSSSFSFSRTGRRTL